MQETILRKILPKTTKVDSGTECMVNVLKIRTLYSVLFWPNFCFFMQLFLKNT